MGPDQGMQALIDLPRVRQCENLILYTRLFSPFDVGDVYSLNVYFAIGCTEWERSAHESWGGRRPEKQALLHETTARSSYEGDKAALATS